ncbi:NHL repeat-containing protein [Bythopirellula goksoeyrii]|uniref:Low-density lipoprotein receptor repeat class B n=1 Tax=Bythopirellula goksoeyrii TaxID=1400387 RepID=A0A5B9Q783_9BACT|nr:hypothetical protein [Bythopirellula goksoeyrii]QEG33580.1 Low-density lipoprotein receptor repeat class B [Bythopirellula goksoeyrii]
MPRHSRLPIALTFCIMTFTFARTALAVDIIWSDSNTDQILRAPLDGSGPVVELYGSSDYPGAPSALSPRDVAVDGDYIYWADFSTDQILRGPLDGSGPVTALYDSLDGVSSAHGLAVQGGFLYWTAFPNELIQRGSIDGTAPVVDLFDLVDDDLGKPYDLAIDGDFLYWTGITGHILRGPLDGSGAVVELFGVADLPGGSHYLRGIATDGEYVYWTDTASDQILRGAIDGSGSVIELYNAADHPGSPTNISAYGIVANDDFLYWTDGGSDSILMAPADGSGPVTQLYTASPFPNFLVIRDSAGDFDKNGDTDGNDFLAWLRGDSPNPLSASDLAEWQANYGAESSLGVSLLVNGVTIPEPTSGLLLVFAMFTAFARQCPVLAQHH